jgi:steroid delta-isomerase-like uncharacterized protein
MSQATCEEVMRRYLMEVVTAGRLEVLDEIADEQMVDHAALAAGWGEGRSGLERHVRYFRRCIPDPDITIERLVASDREVVGVWRVRGVHSAELFGIPATGKTIEWTNASIFRVEQGKIVDYVVVPGALEAVARMGVPIELPAAG